MTVVFLILKQIKIKNSKRKILDEFKTLKMLVLRMFYSPQN